MLSPSIERLVAALRERDANLLRHSERAAHYANIIGQSLGMKSGQLAALHTGSILHDLGKIVVPTSVLRKPAPLNAEEWDIIRRHPIDGYRGLVGKTDDMVLEAVLHHHEWYDGRGYPHHLKGEDIPILARVIAIADSFDAMTTAHLPYRPPLSLETAGEEVLLCAGTQFDPVLVEVFSDIFDRITEAYTEIRLQTQASPAPVSVPRVVITGEPVPVRRAYQPDEFEQAM